MSHSFPPRRYRVGDRVMLTSKAYREVGKLDEIPEGTQGTVESLIERSGAQIDHQIRVNWDNRVYTKGMWEYDFVPAPFVRKQDYSID